MNVTELHGGPFLVPHRRDGTNPDDLPIWNLTGAFFRLAATKLKEPKPRV